MGKKSPRPPTPPDPKETAAAQGAINRETAIAQSLLNQVDTITPFGSSRFEQIGGTPIGGGTSFFGGGGGFQGAPRQPASQGDPARFPQPAAPALNPLAAAQLAKNPAQQPPPIIGGGDQFGTAGGSAFSDIPRFRQVIELSEFGQGQLEREQGIQKRFTELGGRQLGSISDALSSPFNLEGLQGQVSNIETRGLADVGDIQRSIGAQDTSADRQRVEDALFRRSSRFLEPAQERERRSLETQLANQGIALGSGAFAEAQGIQTSRQDRARQDAIDAALLAGGGEQSRLFGISQAQGQFGNLAQQQAFGQDFQGRASDFGQAQVNAALQNRARQQGIQERVLQRTQPIQEASALLGQGGQIQLPQFAGAPQTGIAGTDFTGLQAQQFAAQQSAFNQASASQSAALGGILGLGGQLGAAAIFSDVRLKENIIPLGREGIHKMYHFSYKDDPENRIYKGVMAQDILETIPEAVINAEDGFLMVNYDMLGIRMTEVLH